MAEPLFEIKIKVAQQHDSDTLSAQELSNGYWYNQNALKPNLVAVYRLGGLTTAAAIFCEDLISSDAYDTDDSRPYLDVPFLAIYALGPKPTDKNHEQTQSIVNTLLHLAKGLGYHRLQATEAVFDGSSNGYAPHQVPHYALDRERAITVGNSHGYSATPVSIDPAVIARLDSLAR